MQKKRDQRIGLNGSVKNGIVTVFVANPPSGIARQEGTGEGQTD